MLVPLHLYLAGPMTGITHYNFPTFDHAREELRNHGYEVGCPAEMDRDEGFDPIANDYDGTENLDKLGFDLKEAMLRDLTMICNWADGLAVLPHWNRSSGAQAEVATAKALNLPVRSVTDWMGLGHLHLDHLDQLQLDLELNGVGVRSTNDKPQRVQHHARNDDG